MPHLGHDFPQRLVTVITKAVSISLLIILFYILQYIFDMDFICSCTPGLHANGVLYLAVPPVILTWVVTATESLHQRRIFSSWSCFSPNHVCGHVLKFLINYVALSAVWVATVLFDGDWYFCLMTNLNHNETGIPCKDNLTFEEYRIKAIYKTDSLDFGFYVILGLFAVWSIVEILGAYWIRKRTWRNGFGTTRDRLCPPYYRGLYEELLAEQVNIHLKDKLTKIAEKRAEAICKQQLRVIEDHEDQSIDMGDGDGSVESIVFEAWQQISASDLYLK